MSGYIFHERLSGLVDVAQPLFGGGIDLGLGAVDLGEAFLGRIKYVLFGGITRGIKLLDEVRLGGVGGGLECRLMIVPFAFKIIGMVRLIFAGMKFLADALGDLLSRGVHRAFGLGDLLGVRFVNRIDRLAGLAFAFRELAELDLKGLRHFGE